MALSPVAAQASVTPVSSVSGTTTRRRRATADTAARAAELPPAARQASRPTSVATAILAACPARDFSPARRRLTALRLAAQGIVRATGDPAPDDPTEVVRGMLAHAGPGLRGRPLVDRAAHGILDQRSIEAVHETGEFVRSWPMRGTLHFVAADDLPWMLSLTGSGWCARPRGVAANSNSTSPSSTAPSRSRASGWPTARRARAPSCSPPGSRGSATTGQRGVHLLAQLAQTAVIVMVGQHDWALLEHRVPPSAAARARRRPARVRPEVLPPRTAPPPNGTSPGGHR